MQDQNSRPNVRYGSKLAYFAVLRILSAISALLATSSVVRLLISAIFNRLQHTALQNITKHLICNGAQDYCQSSAGTVTRFPALSADHYGWPFQDAGMEGWNPIDKSYLRKYVNEQWPPS